MEPPLPKPVSVFVRLLGATTVLAQVVLGSAFIAGWIFVIRKFVLPYIHQILNSNPSDRSVWHFYAIIGISSFFGLVGLYIARNGLIELIYILSGKPLGPQARKLDQAIRNTQEAISQNLATTSQTLGVKPTKKRSRFIVKPKDLSQALIQELPDGSLLMSSKNAYRKGAVGLTIFTLFWDGFIIFALSRAGGSFIAFTSVFMLPFVLVGVALIAGCIYLWLGSLHPIVEMVLPKTPLLTGETLHVRWSFKGRSSRIQSIKFKLVGEEIARFVVGTDTQTRRHIFLEKTVCESTLDPRMEQSGEFQISIPAGMPHSFEGNFNEILWNLKFQGDAPRWVDLFMNFKIPVKVGGSSK